MVYARTEWLHQPRTVVNDSTGQVVEKEWFVYDGLGSCRAMVKPNAQGTEAVLVARYDYDVYGAVRTQSGSSSNKFKYVAGIGHPTDEETGLIYMRARYYEPGTGRFVSEDPAGHGVNWYLYAGGDPANKVDPDGRLFTLVGVVLVSILIQWLRGTESIKVSLPPVLAQMLGSGDALLVGYIIWQGGHRQPIDWRVAAALYFLGFITPYGISLVAGGGGGAANAIVIGMLMRELAFILFEGDA